LAELSLSDVMKAFQDETFTIENKLQKWMSVVPQWPWVFFQKEQGTRDKKLPEGSRRYDKAFLICHPAWEGVRALEGKFGPSSQRRTDNLTVYPRKLNSRGEMKPYGALFIVDASRVREFAREVRALIRSESRTSTASAARASDAVASTPEPLVKVDSPEPEGALSSEQGYEQDPEIRRILERYAVERALEHYKPKTTRIEEKGQPYDLDCYTAGGGHFRVEVKGTRTNGDAVIVTRNEVQHARKGSPRVELFILSDISLGGGPGAYVATGGEVRILEDWRPTEAQALLRCLRRR